jgi:hypothetical protein
LLVVFPGDRSTAEDYLGWTTLPLQGIAVKELPHLDRARTLTWQSDGHPLLRRFQRGTAPPRLSIRQYLAGTGLAEDARVVISQGPQVPFLLERDAGTGKVLMFTVAADRTWSDFPLSPFYLPILSQLVEYSAGVGIAAPYIWSAGSLPLEQVVPGATRETTLLGPDTRPVPVSSAVVDGMAQLRVENLDRPGIYDLAGGGPVLAVNVPRDESDLTRLNKAELERILGADALYVADDAETLQRLMTEHHVGRTFGEHLLWIVLVLVAIEFVYANRLARARPALSDQLSVEPSGRIKGHAEAVS